MKIGIIIPDRNDRPLFLENCLRMIRAQTLQPAIVELVNDPPLSQDKDITWRYRTGYERLRNKGLDVIALWENDDYYSPDYLQTMVDEWVRHGRPNIFGTGSTIYYHIRMFKYFTLYHDKGLDFRASAMNTLIVPDMNFKWCIDKEPYTDLHLWKNIKGLVFKPDKIISLGIKHGEGLCGGGSHIDRLYRYNFTDPTKGFLKSAMDEESFNFYSKYYNEGKSVF